MWDNRVWDRNSIFKTLWASSHTKEQRQGQDYYATDPVSIDMLLQKTSFQKDIREPACGEWHLSKALERHWYNVRSTDLVDREYGEWWVDFLLYLWAQRHWDIVTNPPYKYAREFVEKALKQTQEWSRIAMFLKIQFLEWAARRKLFDRNPPQKIYVFSKRIKCAKRWNFDSISSSAVCYAWFIWENWYTGSTTIEWL